MFHLTRYRNVFFAISLAIIVPGLLALAIWHLNLGIDFTNGTTIRLRFQQANVRTTDVAKAFSSAGAQDVHVFASTAKGTNIQPSQYAYIQFSRPIGKAEVEAVKQRLSDSKYKLPNVALDHVDYPIGGGATQHGLIVVHFASKVTAEQVNAALTDLPPTDAPPDAAASGVTTPAVATTTVAPTVAPKATVAPTAAPKATAAKSTPAATVTATPGVTPATAQTFPVSVTSVLLGNNLQTYEVDTQTDLVNTPQQLKSKTPNVNAIVASLAQKYGPVYVEEKTAVGPAIAGETAVNALLAVLAAALAILIYIGIAFRKVGSLELSFRFGASAILALLHDALVVLGLWAIFGHFFNFKVDTLFLTAVLTVIGFSVHDTIVVFDRIRENLQRRTSENFDTVVNTSLIQTMSRSLNTSLTVILVLSAETLFGGASIREFVLALLIGIASGTYSSIFNASMILSVWQGSAGKRARAAVVRSNNRTASPAGVRV